MARPRVPLISKRKALEVALDIIDNEGIDSLSIRRLADRLKVNGASLYHHFENKDAILVGAATLALRSARAPEPKGEPWRVWVLRDARRLRQAFREHPDLVPVMLSHRPLGIGAAQVDATVALLEAEVPIGAIAPMLEALELYTVGSALHERGVAGPEAPDPAETPRLAEAARQRALTPDEVFDLVCEKIIDTVLETASGNGQSMPSGPADPPERNWRTNGSSDAKASSASP